MRAMAVLIAALAATPAAAQASPPPAPPSQILVSGSGTVKTPPDVATIGFSLRGEGATSDEAVVQLRDKARRVSAGVGGMLGKQASYHSSAFSIAQVRPKDCDANSYGPQRLSTGDCAIIGYVATMPVTVETGRVGDAATLTGLIGRLGGVDASIRGFDLRNADAARRQAMQAALANARDQARMIAEGSGAHLGPLLRVQDADYHEVTIEMAAQATGDSAMPPPPPPPPPPAAPVRIDIAPEPIATTVRVMAAYAIDR